MQRFLVFMILGLVLLAFSMPAWSLWGSQATLEGTVQNIQANMITLTDESSVASAEAQSVSVVVDEETQYAQLASLEELTIGDKIEVKYKEEAGNKIATSISVLEEAAIPDPLEPRASAPEAEGTAPQTSAPSPSY